MGSNLAKGVGQVATDKVGSMAASASDRIANTTGGKVASAIRNSMSASGSDAGSADTRSVHHAASGTASARDSFDGDSLAGATQAGTESSSTNDEVAAFVNRRQAKSA
jgi:type IV secretion system protein TrbL